ncbi:MAG: GWxTD domain-containing protein [Gemmatimonadota bacterium]
MLSTLLRIIALLAGQAKPDTALIVTAVRFFRADPAQAPGQTQVTAFIRLPAELARPGRSGETSVALAIRVADEHGNTLYEQNWQKRSAVPSPRGPADRLDLIRFSLGAGSYRLEANAVDSVSGRRARAVVLVEGYTSQPFASDLLLSPLVRPVAAQDTIPQPGEFRRGGLIVAIAPDVVVGGTGATLSYFFETYSGTALDAKLALAVRDSAAGTMKRTGPFNVRVAAGIGLLSGQIDVADLSQGAYELVATLTSAGQKTDRASAFRIDPAVAMTPAALSDEAYFATLQSPQLDLAFAPLSVIAPPNELAAWSQARTDDEKRALLAGFWKKRDPAPKVVGNERRAQFYEGVIYANAFYADGRRRLAGWETDRGRVFLRQGPATQVLQRQQRGPVPTYEVWRYFDRGGRYYIFVDRGAGNYQLVRGNDPAEPGDRRWQEILTPKGVREVVGFLGREVLMP